MGQGNRYRMGRGWMLSAFLLKTFDDGLENFAVGNCVGIIEVVVYGTLLINVKSSDGIEVDAFFSETVIFACCLVCFQLNVGVLLNFVSI